MGASPGVVEGVARVIHDPGSEDMEPGEIIVCSVTDPSWVSLIVLSAGIVADIGGPLSHAAIVARELGVPCVIATKIATTMLHDGDRIRIDGSAGTVEILERATSHIAFEDQGAASV
jgi:pyruvate, water dikinase